jgi:uncharacterized repeat protein (TIGR01451 family)/gliding motility-associated-like protein
MNANSVVITDNINLTVISNPEYSVDGGAIWLAWGGSLNIGNLNFGDSYSLQIRGEVQSNASGNISNTAGVSSNTPDPDTSNNTSTVSTVVNRVADVQIIKELVEEQSNLSAGSEIVYRLTYINNGPSDATNYMVYDQVPSMLENVEASRCESGFVPWNGSANMGTVVAGGECTVLIRATISSDFNGSITNTATVSSDADDPDLDNNTSTVTHDVESYADLRVIKQASQNPVVAGTEFTYTINVSNLGLSDAQDVVVTDVLPSELIVIGVETEKGTWSAPYWNVGLLENGSTVTMEINVRVKQDQPQGSTITNYVSVESSTFDPFLPNNSDTRSVLVNAVADVEVRKYVNKDEASAGETITYTIWASNNGSSDAQNVYIQDLIPSGLTIERVNAQMGSWGAPVWNIGTLQTGISTSMEIVARIDPGMAEGSVISNTASIHSSTSDPDEENNTSTVTTLVNSDYNLNVVKTASSSTVVAGEEFTYTIRLENQGPSHAYNLVVSDTLSSYLEFVSGSGNAQHENGIVTWSMFELKAGVQSSMSLTVRVDPDTPDGSEIRNIALAFTETGDTIEGDPNIITVISNTDFAVVKTADKQVVEAGDVVTYNLTIRNMGEQIAENAILVDTLSSHLTFMLATGNYSVSGNIITWHLGDFGQNEVKNVSLIARVKADTPNGTVIPNTAFASSDNIDEDSESNTELITVISYTEFSIQKTANASTVNAGENIIYTIDITNEGPSVSNNIHVSDELPDGVTFVSASDGGELNAYTVNWTIQTLAVGESKSLILVVKTDPALPQGTIIYNTAVVQSDETETPEPSNEEEVEIDTYFELDVEKIAQSGTVFPGANVTYFIDVSNNGPSNAHNISVVDELPAELSFVSANNSGYYSDGFVYWDIDSIVANTTLRLSLEVQVNSDVEHQTEIRNIALTYKPDVDDPEDTDTSIVIVGFDYEIYISKIASDTAVFAGEEIDYTISLLNEGDMDLFGLIVEDTLQGNVAFLSASHDAIFANGVVQWNIAEIGAGEQIDLTVSVEVGEENENGTLIYNVAWLSDDYSDNPHSSDTTIVEVISETDLEITKNASQSIVNAGSEVEYVILVDNRGPGNSYDLVVADTIPEGLTVINISEYGVIDNGVVVWTIPVLPEGNSFTVSFTASTNARLPHNTAIDNVAYTWSTNSDTVRVETVSTITINNDPGLSVSKNATSTQAQIGDTVQYSIEVSNTGYGVASNVYVHDNLPPELTLVSASDGGESISENTVEWLIGDLDEGESRIVWISAVLNENAVEGSVVANFAFTSGGNRDSVDVEEPAVIEVLSPDDIIANDDYSSIEYFYEGIAIFDILENDSLNGRIATLAEVVISIVEESGNPNIMLDVNTGEVIVSGTVPVGTYQITYRICETVNPANCDEAIITIEVVDNCEMIIPDGFSPNGDGVGDYFRITCIDRYPNAKIEIFNRWGNMVYSKENYGNIDVWGETEAWWDGRSQHRWNLSDDLLPVGTYFYVLRLNDTAEPLTGSIFLNR